VAVSHDILTRHCGYGRIVEVITSGGEVTGLVLDAAIDVRAELDMLAAPDVLAEGDMLDVGVTTGIAIRRTDGTTTVHALSGGGGPSEELILSHSAPVETVAGRMAIDVGCLVVAGTIGREYLRLIVSEIRNGKGLTAQLTLVDEAPQIWEAVNG
jgi:hypothetical protein